MVSRRSTSRKMDKIEQRYWNWKDSDFYIDFFTRASEAHRTYVMYLQDIPCEFPCILLFCCENQSSLKWNWNGLVYQDLWLNVIMSGPQCSCIWPGNNHLDWKRPFVWHVPFFCFACSLGADFSDVHQFLQTVENHIQKSSKKYVWT